jgi:hypothetical protein
MKRMLFYITVLCLITSVSWAMFCNTSQGTNGWIDHGMSQQAILAACGQPDSVVEIDKNNKHLNVTQYWSYQQQSKQFLPQTEVPAPYTQMKVNTAGNTLVVELYNNHITSLAVNGTFVSSGGCPNGGFVRVGDTARMLAARCGTATQVSYQYEKVDTSALPLITQWTYQLQGGRSLTIQFQQGVVSELNQ